MKQKYLCTAEAPTGNNQSEITDKLGYGQRWQFSRRHIDNLIAQGLPHLKIGARRVRIVIPEADRWMQERFGVQRHRLVKQENREGRSS